MNLPPATPFEMTPPVTADPGGSLGVGPASAGTALVTLSVPLIGLLHVLPPSDRINPMTRTISEYALGTNGWLFDLAVLALALGSAMVTAALVRARVFGVASPAALLLLAWCTGLLVLVVFEKHNWQVGPSLGGHVHRVASLVAFLSLPAGALLAARAGRRQPEWRRPAACTRWSAIAAVASLSPLLYAIALNMFAGVSWWRVFPLGAVERAFSLAEVLVVLTLGYWAVRAARPTTIAVDPRSGTESDVLRPVPHRHLDHQG